MTTVTAIRGDAIARYTAESRRQIGRTKAQVLDAIGRASIAQRPCHEVTAQDVIAYAQSLRQTRAAATVANYLSHLQAVFAVARAAWGMPLDPQVMKDALAVTRKLGVTSKSSDRDLPHEAIEVIEQMPRVAPEIFPFAAETISTAFTRACQILGINDLHFYDLRHEGVSRLFEMCWTIPKVAAVSGHLSWQSLKRYTHLRHVGDRWKK